MNLDAGTVWLVDEHYSDRLELWATAGDAEVFNEVNFSLEGSRTGFTIRSNRTKFSPMIEHDTKYQYPELAREAGFVSTI